MEKRSRNALIIIIIIIITPVATQAPGVVGSVLELVGPMSVYCDWVR